MFPPQATENLATYIGVGLFTFASVGALIVFAWKAIRGAVKSRSRPAVSALVAALGTAWGIVLMVGVNDHAAALKRYRFSLDQVIRIDARVLEADRSHPIGPTVSVADGEVISGLRDLHRSEPAQFSDHDSPRGGHQLVLHLRDGSTRVINLSSRTSRASGFRHVEAKLSTGASGGVYENPAIHDWFQREIYPQFNSQVKP